MFWPPKADGADAVFTTLRSAGVMAVDAVAVLFAGFGSVVVELTVAVFAVEPLTVITIWNVADAPAERVPIEQVTVPCAPGAGLMQLNVGPAVCDSETNVLPAGSGSVIVTFSASLGPRFVTMIVSVAFEPVLTFDGPVFEIARSA